MKKLFLLISFFAILPVNAGVYEDALSGNDIVFLYLYSSYCKSCSTIAPYYEDIVNSHKEIKGVKVNADTSYGMSLLRKFRIMYVPYFVLTNSKSGKSVSVNSYCLVDNICMERVLKGIKG